MLSDRKGDAVRIMLCAGLVACSDGGSSARSTDASQPDSNMTPIDAGALDSGFMIDGGRPDAAVDASVPDSAVVDAGEGPSAQVDLTFSGVCSPDFRGDLIVSGDTQLSISSVRDGLIQASLQLDLGANTGAQIISTRGRLETGLIINVLTAQTWTNGSTDTDVISGSAPDPVRGTLLISAFRPEIGVSDVTFVDVVLVSPVDDAKCALSGTIRSVRLGM